MSYPGGQGPDPHRDPGVDATGGYEAPPIEQSPQSAYEIPSPPIDYPPPGYYIDPLPPAPGPTFGPTGYAGPPPGYPGPFGYADGYGAPQPVGTNPLAIGALVCAVVGLFCGIGSIIGIVLGFIALNQIKSTGQAGRGLAIGAIVLGFAAVAVGLVTAVLIMSQ
jgi:Domain of unknown function (DUF4190)